MRSSSFDVRLQLLQGVESRIMAGKELQVKKYGAPGEIRTHDLTLRRRSLYPAELRARTFRIQHWRELLRKAQCLRSSQ